MHQNDNNMQQVQQYTPNSTDSPVFVQPTQLSTRSISTYQLVSIFQGVLRTQIYDAIIGGVHQVGQDVDAGQAILAELLATSILVLAVLMVACDDRNKSVLGPLAIGLSVGGGIFAM